MHVKCTKNTKGHKKDRPIKGGNLRSLDSLVNLYSRFSKLLVDGSNTHVELVGYVSDIVALAVAHSDNFGLERGYAALTNMAREFLSGGKSQCSIYLFANVVYLSPPPSSSLCAELLLGCNHRLRSSLVC